MYSRMTLEFLAKQPLLAIPVPPSGCQASLLGRVQKLWTVDEAAKRISVNHENSLITRLSLRLHSMSPEIRPIPDFILES